MKKILVTGSAGFIGFHLSERLLNEGYQVLGLDGITDYYDIKLKKSRINILKNHLGFSFYEEMLENKDSISQIIEEEKPNIIVHLAAQAGVRYSIKDPQSYISSNIIGSFNLLEIIKGMELEHFLFASTSSVYGNNKNLPYKETSATDTQLSLYAATKKSVESICHSYANIWSIPITTFRFFSVYGPWGRPDMALFKFAKLIEEGKHIEIYNKGEMYRDFTYIDDLVEAIVRLIKIPPPSSMEIPYRTVNIGNSEKVYLLNFIKELEKNLGKKAKRKLLGMQPGDVKETWADISLLKDLTGFTPSVDYKLGVKKFTEWYLDYYSDK